MYITSINDHNKYVVHEPPINSEDALKELNQSPCKFDSYENKRQ